MHADPFIFWAELYSIILLIFRTALVAIGMTLELSGLTS